MAIKESSMGVANNQEIVQQFDHAIFLLKDKGWTQGGSARHATTPTRNDPNKKAVVASTSDEAACFCLSGALTRAIYDMPMAMYGPAFSVLEQAVARTVRRPCSIIEFNDNIAKSKDDVINVLELAKRIAQEGNVR